MSSSARSSCDRTSLLLAISRPPVLSERAPEHALRVDRDRVLGHLGRQHVLAGHRAAAARLDLPAHVLARLVEVALRTVVVRGGAQAPRVDRVDAEVRPVRLARPPSGTAARAGSAPAGPGRSRRSPCARRAPAAAARGRTGRTASCCRAGCARSTPRSRPPAARRWRRPPRSRPGRPRRRPRRRRRPSRRRRRTPRGRSRGSRCPAAVSITAALGRRPFGSSVPQASSTAAARRVAVVRELLEQAQAVAEVEDGEEHVGAAPPFARARARRCVRTPGPRRRASRRPA